MLAHLRLWRQFWVVAFTQETAFRANFFVSIFQGLTQIALAALTFAIIYQFTPTIAGWTQAQVLMVVGLYRIVDGLISTQIGPNLRSINGYVETGELDLLLLRPVESQFLVSTRMVQLPELMSVLIGLALTIYAGQQAGVAWSIGNVLAATLSLICGVIMFYALWFMLMTFALWFTWSPFEQIFYTVFDTARYPADFFKGGVRTFLTFVVPVAFVTSIPADALLGRADPWLLLLAPILAGTTLYASHLFWNYALRHYGSASS